MGDGEYEVIYLDTKSSCPDKEKHDDKHKDFMKWYLVRFHNSDYLREYQQLEHGTNREE